MTHRTPVSGSHSTEDRSVMSGVTGSFRYGAFISYSHAGDREFVQEFQRGLERFAKPWNKIRSTRIFRDESDLTAAPGLWSVLEEALASSEWFILVASTESAASEWVNKEVLWWLEQREVDRVLIVLTGGEILWDKIHDDFDSEVTTAVPKALYDILPQEPLWVDARWSRNAETYDIDDPRMRQAVVDVASPVRGVDKDALVGEAEREHRRTRRVTRAAIVGLATLLVAALVSTGLAWVQRSAAVEATNAAKEATRVAQARQLASLALQYAEEDVGLAATFALAGHTMDENPQTSSALASLAQASPQMTAAAHASSPVSAMADCLASGKVVAGLDDGEIISWDFTTTRPVTMGRLPGKIISVAASSDARIFAATDGNQVLVGQAESARTIDLPADGVSDVSLSPDGQTLLLNAEGSLWAVDLLSAETVRVQWPEWGGDSGGVKTIFDEAGNVTLFDGTYGFFARMRPESWDVVSEGRVAFGMYQTLVANSPDGSFLAASTKMSDLVWAWPSTAEGDDESWVQSVGAGVDTDSGALAVSFDGARIAMSTAEGVVVAGTNDDSDRLLLVGGGTTDYLQFDTAGVLISVSGARLMTWDLRQLSRISTRYALPLGSSCAGCEGPSVVVSPEGTKVTSIDGFGEHGIILTLADGTRTDLPEVTLSSLIYRTPVWSGDILVVPITGATGSSTLPSELPNEPPGVVLWPVVSPPLAMRTSASGDLLAVYNGRVPGRGLAGDEVTTLVWHPVSGHFLRTDTVWPEPAAAASIDPTMRSVAAILTDGRLEVIDVDSRTTWSVDTQSYGSVLWSGDVVVAQRSPEAETERDLGVDVYSASGTLVRTIPTADCYLGAVTNDGSRAAFHCTDRSVVLVDLTTGQAIATLPAVSTSSDAKIGIGMSFDGKHLVTAQLQPADETDDGFITDYDLSTARLRSEVCAVARLNISVDEWTGYAEGIDQPTRLC